MNKSSSNIRIYVACLASYNNAILHGHWIDADQSEEGIWEGIKDVLASSPIPEAEEYAIHDYEGFYRISIEEYESIATIASIAHFIAEHGELGAELVSYYGDIDSARTAMNDHYAGQYSSVADYAQSVTEETSEIPKNLQSYIDYDKMARDLMINDVVAIQLGHDEVHIFWQH